MSDRCKHYRSQRLLQFRHVVRNVSYGEIGPHPTRSGTGSRISRHISCSLGVTRYPETCPGSQITTPLRTLAPTSPLPSRH
ncbi:MAG: hypothetical protein ACYST3_09905 [Planctomycetota bacterium]